ncbi:MAG: methyltransferase [Muribaculaceae bacterium]|nr:methyltransferase [Muribaculaceae bacterium]
MQSYRNSPTFALMETSVFRFKEFRVEHSRSSMKVGVDAVLLGAWAVSIKKEPYILDVGTGCGVIALMLAQRYPAATIQGIDIDEASISEAQTNINNSPWGSRLSAALKRFPEDILNSSQRYDLIVSNPPFFDSGVKNPTTPREKARHQAALSPYSLIENSPSLLNTGGSLCMIIPYEILAKVMKLVEEKGLCVNKVCYVKNNIKRPVKRVMIEIGFPKEKEDNVEVEHLILFENGEPTPAYRALTGIFYLNM